MTKQNNNNLSAARINKNDEFYTFFSDIEAELINYKDHFKNKIVYCNCDDPTWSQFYTYLKHAFNHFELSKLITTHYVANGTSYKREYDGTNEVDTPLTGNGDFRSEECKAILDEADIVITNPPFSLFREFIALLVEKQKHFLIIGNNNAITYKECFKLIEENKMWLGVSPRNMLFTTATNEQIQVNACWFTNLTHLKRNQPLDLYKTYSPTEYFKYDNYNAIEVSKVKDIPKDYYQPMGVPITFLDKFCPTQFDIIGATESEGKGFSKGLWLASSGVAQPLLNGERVYKRLFIKHKNPVINQENNQ